MASTNEQAPKKSDSETRYFAASKPKPAERTAKDTPKAPVVFSDWASI